MSRKKINLEKVLASLNIRCPLCGAELAPAERKRINWDLVECAKCGGRFVQGCLLP